MRRRMRTILPSSISWKYIQGEIKSVGHCHVCTLSTHHPQQPRYGINLNTHWATDDEKWRKLTMHTHSGYRRKAFHSWTYGRAWGTLCWVKWHRRKIPLNLTYIQSKRADFVSESRMVVEDVSDKVEGMGGVSQEDSLQNADDTFYCIHTWSIVCMHLIHRGGIKCTYVHTYMHAYIHMCVHTYMYHMHDFIFIYKYMLYHILYM